MKEPATLAEIILIIIALVGMVSIGAALGQAIRAYFKIEDR